MFASTHCARRLACAAYLSTSLIFGVTAAVAQQAESLEEVVVTAQKRTENAQKVPIAVTVFTQQALQTKDISDVAGMGRLTPNVNLDTASPFGGSNEVLSASIRGIGQDDFAFNLDPGVGVYVDGIYLARTVGANVNLLDVNQVEILKGPQGTLFGRNTIGGAINVTTRTPGDIFKGEVDATIGSYSRRDFQGTVDIPISDTLLSTLTFSSLLRDGYQKRIPYPSSTPYTLDPPNAFHASDTGTYSTSGGQGEQVLRGKLLWKASNAVTVTTTLDWTHVASSAVPESLLQAEVDPATPGVAFGFFYNACLQGIPFAGPNTALVCGPRGPGLSGGNTGVSTGNTALTTGNRLLYGNQFVTGNPDTTYATGQNFDKLDAYGVAVTVDWNIADSLDLKSISGYRRLNWAAGVDADGSPLPMLELSFRENQHQSSQEEQLTGIAFHDALKWVAGLYYFNEAGSIHDFVTFPGGLLQVDGPNYLETTSYAGYLHADWRVWQELSVIAGARYSLDHKTFEGQQHDLNAFAYKISGCYPVTAACATLLGFPDPNNPLQYMPPGTVTQNFYQFTPTAGLQYELTGNLMTYYTYSKGFKTGGWTTRLSNPVSVQPSFGPEKARTNEIGIKSEFLERRLLVNAAAFYTKYDSIQLNFEEGVSPTYKNSGNASILGGELEIHALLGGGFSLNGAAGYTDAYYTYIEPGLNGAVPNCTPTTPCTTLDSKLPKTPRWKLSLSPEYSFSLPNQSEIRIGADYTHTTSMYNDAINTPLLRRPDTNMLNASITYGSPSSSYEVTVGGSNLTQDRYITTGQENTAGGEIYGTYNPPREFYAALRYKFK